jgi:hypothetical protein
MGLRMAGTASRKRVLCCTPVPHVAGRSQARTRAGGAPNAEASLQPCLCLAAAPSCSLPPRRGPSRSPSSGRTRSRSAPSQPGRKEDKRCPPSRNPSAKTLGVGIERSLATVPLRSVRPAGSPVTISCPPTDRYFVRSCPARLRARRRRRGLDVDHASLGQPCPRGVSGLAPRRRSGFSPRFTRRPSRRPVAPRRRAPLAGLRGRAQ